MTGTVWLASYPKSGNTWFRMVNANLGAEGDTAADINDLPERGGIASARGPFDHLVLIDSGLLTHDEIDCLRPRVYAELARGAEDDLDSPVTSGVRLVKAHDAYTLTPLGEPVHLVRDEDLRADPVPRLLAAMTFSGRAVTPDAVENAVRLSDFGKLQAQERDNGFRESRRGKSFFRRGKAGGWRDELNAEQVARIEAAHAPMMARLGYDLAEISEVIKQ